MNRLALLVYPLLLASQALADAPDKAAWQLFVQMAAPAKGVKAVQYETWASDDDIYGANPHWPSTAALKLLTKSLGGTASAPHPTRLMVAPASACAKPQDSGAGNFPADGCIGEEVRHNSLVYNTLTANNFNTVKGLVAAYATGKPIMLPMGSIIAKADWVPIDDLMRWQPAYRNAAQVRAAFYTNSASLGGRAREFALVGISIQSKSLPDWLWFTVEHRSNPGRCDIIGCHDSFGATKSDVAPVSMANSDYGPCAKTPALAALFASAGLDPVWNNYCLKGTQTHYVTKTGKPLILGNSVVERINHGIAIPHISCITCHATASFDKNGQGNFAALKRTPVGQVDPQWLTGYDRADFMWGLLDAK
jgi:hypothetical protein